MNIKDLALHLNVSVGTVSRVLAGRGDEVRIAKTTQRRILAAAETMGVQPNELARSLRLKVTRTIGLLIPDISNPFFAAFARQVEQQARAAGYAVLLADAQESVEVEAECARVLFNRRIDGLIVAPVGGECSHLETLRTRGLPMTQVDRIFDSLKVTSVVTDNFHAAQNAVRHLVKRGHRDIACLQGKPTSSANMERVRGYRTAIAAAGFKFRKDWLVGEDYSPQNGQIVAARLLSMSPRPTAILAMGNLLALGTLKAAQEQHLKIPNDLALVSFDDAPWATLLSPTLTTVAQPVEKMGEQAFQELLAAITAQKPPRAKKIVLYARLIERGSS